ncbi:uncharacterized protein [Typha latifolia]|uniref:uncharacterized protein n=1 Tax=Typha latifolia TaxID=4733 RepID=UPI003C2EF643
MTEVKEQRPNSPPAKEINLKEALDLLNSLVSLSFLVLCFHVKWQLIRDKLEKLGSGLIAAADSKLSVENSALNEFLQSLVATLNDINLLAHQCVDESYSGGKLLLRSDLDMVSSKLDQYLNSLKEIYVSEVQLHSQAITPLKPNAGASLEDMRFYVKDLFSRLRIGDLGMRAETLVMLNEVLCEDEKYARIAVLEVVDGVSLLLNFLESRDDGIQEEAAGAFAMISMVSSCKEALRGVIGPLIRVLEIGSGLVKERAAQTLKKLTENSNNVWSVCAHGGVSILLKTCSNGANSGELIVSSCAILRNLSHVEEIKGFMIEGGVVSILIKLLQSKEESCKIQATEFLHAMASGDDKIKKKIINEGVIESLIQLLDPNFECSSKARVAALRATDFFCFSSANLIDILMDSGFLVWLLILLKNGDISIQELALKVVSHFVGISEEHKKAIGKAGYMQEIVRLLESKSLEVRKMAAETLCNLVIIPANRKILIKDDRNINRIMRMLDCNEEKLMTKKCLLSLLMSLSDSNTGRRKISASGYVSKLEKLAQSDVIEAKQIVKKLSSNRIRSILHGIWIM